MHLNGSIVSGYATSNNSISTAWPEYGCGPPAVRGWSSDRGTPPFTRLLVHSFARSPAGPAWPRGPVVPVRHSTGLLSHSFTGPMATSRIVRGTRRGPRRGPHRDQIGVHWDHAEDHIGVQWDHIGAASDRGPEQRGPAHRRAGRDASMGMRERLEAVTPARPAVPSSGDCRKWRVARRRVSSRRGTCETGTGFVAARPKPRTRPFPGGPVQEPAQGLRRISGAS